MIFHKDNDIFRNEKDYMSSNPIKRFFQRLLDKSILGKIELLIAEARKFGLPENDIKNALINLEYNEVELAFDVIAEQIYEFDIKINKEFYSLAMDICENMKLEKKYNFLEELIEN